MIKQKELTKDQMLAFQRIVRIQRLIDKEISKKKEKLLIFGAGVHTCRLLDCFDFSPATIRIIDNKLYGEKIREIVIEQPSKKLFDWADIILISSYYYQESMKNEIDENNRGKVLCLYKEGERPFWTYEAEMSVENAPIVVDETYSYNRFVPKGSAERYEERIDKAFFNAVTKKFFLNYVYEGCRVLEIGAGTGRLSVELYAAGARVTAVDTSEDMLSVLRKKQPKIETITVSGVELPFANEMFDRVMAADVIVHFPNWRDFLREHNRVLKTGGYIVCNMVNGEHLSHISEDIQEATSYIFGGYGWFATVTRRELEEFCEDTGMELVEMTPYNFFGCTGFGYGCLTPGEDLELGGMYHALCKNNEARQIIERFETDIVRKLPEWYTSSNMCVLKKI